MTQIASSQKAETTQIGNHDAASNDSGDVTETIKAIGLAGRAAQAKLARMSDDAKAAALSLIHI